MNKGGGGGGGGRTNDPTQDGIEFSQIAMEPWAGGEGRGSTSARGREERGCGNEMRGKKG